MIKVGLVGCSQTKRTTPCPAFLLYSASPRFTQIYLNAQKECDQIFILSAKHGCLNPHDVIAPYDCYIGDFSKQDIQDWAKKVFQKLSKIEGKWYSYLPSSYRIPLETFIEFEFVLSGDIFTSARALNNTEGNLLGCEGVAQWCIEYIYSEKIAKIGDIKEMMKKRRYAKRTIEAQVSRLGRHPLLIRSGNFVRYRYL